MSLEELAQACGSSVSSVMRLCKALKLSGYKELMKSLCGELSVLEENREFEDIHPGDDPEAVMSHLLTSDFGALRTTMEMNDAAELERAVSLLCRARRTDFYGVGSSGLVALDASNKFGRIGKVAVANTDPHNQYITSLSLRKGAKLLNLDPKNCMVVEDADAGVEAALNGGMRVLGVGSASANPKATFTAASLADADFDEILK